AAARFEIAVEGDGAAAALEKGDHAAGKAEVEARVDLVRLEPGVEHLRVAAPHLAEEEETAAQLLAGAAAMLLPEFVADVLDGVEAEAVDARALRPAQLRVEQELHDVAPLGLEVGKAADAAGEVVAAAQTERGVAQPVLRLGIGQVMAAVAAVVVNDVEQHLDAARVAGLDERAEILRSAEARIEPAEVVGPVAVVGPVGEADLVDVAVDVLDQRIDPDGGDAERRDLVELCAQALEVAAVEGARRLAVDGLVVLRVAVGEAVDENEVEDVLGPGSRRARRGRQKQSEHE